jgi:hypothetical protein
VPSILTGKWDGSRDLLLDSVSIHYRRQEAPRFIGFVPKSGKTKGIMREGHDFLFMLMDPCQALVEPDFILLPVAVRHVDPQPIRSALSKRLAVREFEQRPSDIVLLRVDELRHGICAAPMVQLVGKIELRLIEQPLAQG